MPRLSTKFLRDRRLQNAAVVVVKERQAAQRSLTNWVVHNNFNKHIKWTQRDMDKICRIWKKYTNPSVGMINLS